MSDLLKNREGCEAIMDDIIVFGKSAEEHDENLQNTFQVIKESGLKPANRRQSRILDFGFLVNRTWIPDSNS